MYEIMISMSPAITCWNSDGTKSVTIRPERRVRLTVDPEKKLAFFTGTGTVAFEHLRDADLKLLKTLA